MYRCILCEEQVGAIKRQVSIYFIGAYLMVADIAVLPAGVHHYASADDVGLEEYAGIFNTIMVP